MRRNLYVGIAAVGLAAALGTASLLVGNHGVLQAAGEQAPKFEVDPFWPKPLPNGWVLGQTIGLAVDAQDNVWIIHRPGSLEAKESYQTRNEADCCTAAPDVLAFDQAGNLIQHWGKVEGHDWPSSNHGITVDDQGNVWLGANGAGQPGPAPGSAAQFATPARGAAPAPARGAAPEYAGTAAPAAAGARTYHDSFILKFSKTGQYLGQIGKVNASQGSMDNDNVRGVAQIRFDPKTKELIAADGYGNHRVSVWDPQTMKFKRAWGAYGKPPTDATLPPYQEGQPPAQQFRNPVHCAQPSKDGMIYVCDRVNDRLQVFKTDGTYVSEIMMETKTKGDGSVWEIAFSKDPAEKYMYVADGSNHKIHVFDRLALKEIYSFGSGGRQPGEWYALHSIVTDSKGNIYTTETYRGQRVQKFNYKGIGAVTAANEGAPWPAGKK
jgi:DNA-binding beta-propeller fold protein YncE